MTVLVFLRWPEPCFRANEGDLRFLGSLLPKGAAVVEAKDERTFLRALPKATHVLTWHFKAEWYARAPKLEVVATPAAGRELVALPPEGSRVRVHFGRFQGAIMAESVAAFVLAWARGFFRQRFAPAKVAAWPRTWMGDKVCTVAGTKAVIVGYGHVGHAIGEKLAAIGIETKGLTHAECDALKAGDPRSRPLLSSADWLVLALPSTTGTDDFLDAAFIRLLSPRCVVINVGRGNAVDERALHSALRSRRLAGAYLDVRKYEPSWASANFGTNDDRLAKLGNVVLTPHDSAFAGDYVKRAFAEMKRDGCLRRESCQKKGTKPCALMRN